MKAFYVIALTIVAGVLTGCQTGNPLLGRWETTGFLGFRDVSFTEQKMILAERENQVVYRQEPPYVVVITPDGNEVRVKVEKNEAVAYFGVNEVLMRRIE
ncbi:MAG: hypothetical protein ACOCX1_04750, partial [Fimbriimonadaceae bacterium]